MIQTSVTSPAEQTMTDTTTSRGHDVVTPNQSERSTLIAKQSDSSTEDICFHATPTHTTDLDLDLETTTRDRSNATATNNLDDDIESGDDDASRRLKPIVSIVDLEEGQGRSPEEVRLLLSERSTTKEVTEDTFSSPESEQSESLPAVHANTVGLI